MASGLELNDPETLYRRWEDSRWSPYTVDLSSDQAQWPGLAEKQRGVVYFVLASLMVAEERITTKFSGLAPAGSSEEEVTFDVAEVLEGTLGLTSFKFITDYYGVWYLRETIRQHPEQAGTVRATLRDLLPHVAESLKLPGDGDTSSLLGVSEDDPREFALHMV